MKFTAILLVTIDLSLSCNILAAQDNPFMPMADKKYAEYAQELGDEFLRLIILYDTLEFQKFVGQIREVATKTGSAEWNLQADYYELSLIKMRNHYAQVKLSSEELLGLMQELLKKAQKVSVPQIELRIRYDVIQSYFMTFENYELAFEYCRIQDEQLQEVSSEDIPEKADYYVFIANTYYRFKDYMKANFYYNKILEEKDNVRNHFAKQHARNGLGLFYSEKNELDSSDIYFRAIIHSKPLSSENEPLRELWNGIAEGNIGNNMLLRQEYDQAIPLLKSSIEKVLRYDDYPFAAGRAVDLANIYLKKDNLAEAKRYIDRATAYNKNDKTPRNIHLFYEVLSKYYAATGNNTMSVAYMDSTLEATKQSEEQFSAILLLRMEQKESAKQQQELEREKEKRQQAQLRALILSLGFMVIFGLLGVVFLLYCKKRTAYRELVRKSQEWAQTTNEYNGISIGNKEIEQSISEVDRQLFDQLQQSLQFESLYRDTTLSLDNLAQRMRVNRSYLSRAINLCTGKNFNSYINEYRIKEAVRLMSDNSEKFSLESLAFEVGFNDRKTFYTAFRKMTGLSPSDFRGNLRKE